MNRRDLLRLSDERDMWVRRLIDAERRGYARALHDTAGEFERGIVEGVRIAKAAQHGIVRDLRAHLVMWDGRRVDFGKHRPGDYQGDPAKWAAIQGAAHE